MVPPSCMRSVVDRNVVMRRISVSWYTLWSPNTRAEQFSPRGVAVPLVLRMHFAHDWITHRWLVLGAEFAPWERNCEASCSRKELVDTSAACFLAVRSDMFLLRRCSFPFYGAFFQSCRRAIIIFALVCPSAWKNSARNRRIFTKFDVWVFLVNLYGKFKFHWNRTIIAGTLHEDQYTFLIISRWIKIWQ